MHKKFAYLKSIAVISEDLNNKHMVNTEWNNDLSDNTEERELTDSDFEIEDKEELPHVYSPFSPFFTNEDNQ